MEHSNFISIGLGNVVNTDKIVACVSPESAPIKRLIQEARTNGILIDATYGRKTRSVIVMDSGHVVLSLITPETVSIRLSGKEDKDE